MVIPLLPFYAKTVRRERTDGRPARVLVRRRAAPQRADVGAVLRSLRPASGAARRPLGVGDRVRRLRVLELALAALPVAPRAGRRRRDGERDPGVRRRRDRAGGAREGTRLAVGGDERRRRDRPGARVALVRSDRMRRGSWRRRCACSTSASRGASSSSRATWWKRARATRSRDDRATRCCASSRTRASRRRGSSGSTRSASARSRG